MTLLTRLCRAGQERSAGEILEQAPEAQAVYVPMGDTALIRGVAAAIKQQKPSVESDWSSGGNGAFYFLSWKSGAPTETRIVQHDCGRTQRRGTPDARTFARSRAVDVWFS